MPIKASMLLLIAGLLAGGCREDPPQPEVDAGVHPPVPAARLVGWGHAPANHAVRDEAPLLLRADPETLALAERLTAALRRTKPGLEIRAERLAPDGRADTAPEPTASQYPKLGLGTVPVAPAARGRSDPRRTQLPIARGALTVVVHPDNPLAERGLTLGELRRIFSARAESMDEVEFWGDLGVAGEWTQNPVVRYGHRPGSSLHAYLKEEVLAGAPFKSDLTQLADSVAIVQAVAADPNAIGYAELPSTGHRVAAVPIAERRGLDPIAPTAEAVAAGTYPLLPLVHVQLHEGATPWQRAEIAALLDFIYGEHGQAIVAASGYQPLPQHLIAEIRARLGLTPNRTQPTQTTEANP